MRPTASDRRIDRPQWSALANAQRQRVDALLARHPTTLPDTSTPHPMWGFLFSYYSFRPGALRRWHPGAGIEIVGGHRYRDLAGYRATPDGAIVDDDFLSRRLPTVRFVAQLMARTADRPAQFTCFGMHEWAMVYRSARDRRHDVPLRLSAAQTDAVVESNPLRCTHFDAFRFFTDAAAPRNSTVLTRDRQLDDEQPGCIHAGMDLYKWAYKLSPLIESELVVDAFELALAMRELDMRASPYDLRELGLSAVPVDTAAGRAKYAREQKRLADQAAVLRARIERASTSLIDLSGDSIGDSPSKTPPARNLTGR